MNEEPTYKGSMERSLTDERGLSRALCYICLRPMPLRKDGAVRVHSPVGQRCPGSGSPPLPHDTSSADAPRQTGTQTPPPMEDFSTLPYVRLLKRLPHASRDQSARKLATILDEVTVVNSASSWMCLLKFPRRCLRVPTRGGRRWSLAKYVNQQLAEESDPPPRSLGPQESQPLHPEPQEPLQLLARRVSEKLEEGDFKGVVRLTCSEDTIASDSEATIAALRSKHPDPHPESIFPEAPNGSAMTVSEGDVMQAI